MSRDLCAANSSDPNFKAVLKYVRLIGECLQNSIDAGSTSIAIRFDLGERSFQIVDDGSGFSDYDLNQTDFANTSVIGGLLNHWKTVEIVTKSSKTSGSQSAVKRVWQNGAIVLWKKVTRSSSGTTIAVSQVTKQFHIRSDFSFDKQDYSSIIKLLKDSLMQICLVYPEASLSIIDLRHNSILFSASKKDQIYERFKDFFGSRYGRLLKQVEQTNEPWTLNGLIGTQPISTDRLQFLFVNKQCVFTSTKIRAFIDYAYRKYTMKPSQLHGIYLIQLQCPTNCFAVTRNDVFERVFTFNNYQPIEKLIELTFKRNFERELIDSVPNTNAKRWCPKPFDVTEIDGYVAGDVANKSGNGSESQPHRHHTESDGCQAKIARKIEYLENMDKPMSEYIMQKFFKSLACYGNDGDGDGDSDGNGDDFGLVTGSRGGSGSAIGSSSGSGNSISSSTLTKSWKSTNLYREEVINFRSHINIRDEQIKCDNNRTRASKHQKVEPVGFETFELDTKLKEIDNSNDPGAITDENNEPFKSFRVSSELSDLFWKNDSLKKDSGLAFSFESPENFREQDNVIEIDKNRPESQSERNQVVDEPIQMHDRCPFVPKGFSQIGRNFATNPPIRSLSPQSKHILNAAIFCEPQPGDDDRNVERTWHPTSTINACVSRADKKLLQNLSPMNFTKDIFDGLKFVGQVDNKYLATQCYYEGGSLLVFFDQHAVDERIRLEQLLEEMCSNGGQKANMLMKPQRIPTMSFELDNSQLNVARFAQQQLLCLGWDFSIHSYSVRIKSVPICLQDKLKKLPKYFHNILVEINEKLKTKTTTSNDELTALPNTLLNVIHTLACRSSVKFGDTLTDAQCESLLQRLRNCSLPFQCAHGRPTLMPICNL